MTKRFMRVASFVVMLCLMFAAVAGCGSGSKNNVTDATKQGESKAGSQAENSKANENLELLEYSVFVNNDGDPMARNRDNPNDVVTPYLEEKFKIRVKEIISITTQSFDERLNQWVAANNMPDYIISGADGCDKAVATGEFYDLTDYIKDMTNFNKYMDPNFWPIYETDEGRRYQIPLIDLNFNSPEYKDDPYNDGLFAHSLWVREDILAKCGYKFTPINELEKTTAAIGKKPTLEQMKIEPAIDTPEAFYEFLKKVKALNLKVGDKEVIPLSIANWSQFHLGSMFDFGHFTLDDNNQADGFLGSKGAKDFYKFIKKLYDEKLLDNDFVIQKPEQLQAKASSGQLASGLWLPDFNASRDSMAKINPEFQLRRIPWPKQTPDKGFFDVYIPGYWKSVISKNLKPEEVKRLTQYFDWMYSDEGLDILTWGPESAGLWEIKDGKKVFKDKEVEEAVLNGIHGKKGADYYGLYDYTDRMPWWSVAAAASPVFNTGNPKSYQRSYAPRFDMFKLTQNIFGATGFNTDGRAAYERGANASAASTYFWAEFSGNKIAKLLVAKNDTEFDAAWDEIYKEFLDKGKYEAARTDMTNWLLKFK